MIEESKYGRFGWATDPEGNRFELWQPAPGPISGRVTAIEDTRDDGPRTILRTSSFPS